MGPHSLHPFLHEGRNEALLAVGHDVLGGTVAQYDVLHEKFRGILGVSVAIARAFAHLVR